MAIFKNILALAVGGPNTEGALRAAKALAAAHGARVRVVHVRTTAQSIAAVVAGEAMIGISAAEFDAIASESEVREGNARAVYQLVFGDSAVTSEFTVFDGQDDQSIAALGRLADVIVVGRPTDDAAGVSAALVRALIFDGGAPVLVAPPKATATVMRHIAVAWNGSAEAARAVKEALPLLEKADSVTVLTVGESGAKARALIDFLDSHGIVASYRSFAPEGSSARARGRALIRAAGECQADGLVMGAFGAGGLSAFLGLGGATEKVCTGSPVAVFLDH